MIDRKPRAFYRTPSPIKVPPRKTVKATIGTIGWNRMGRKDGITYGELISPKSEGWFRAPIPGLYVCTLKYVFSVNTSQSLHHGTRWYGTYLDWDGAGEGESLSDFWESSNAVEGSYTEKAIPYEMELNEGGTIRPVFWQDSDETLDCFGEFWCHLQDE